MDGKSFFFFFFLLRWKRAFLYLYLYFFWIGFSLPDKYNGLGYPACILARPLKGKGRPSRHKLLSTCGMQGPNSVGDEFQVVLIDATRQVLHQRDFAVPNVVANGALASSAMSGGGGRQVLALSVVTSLLIKNELTRSSAFALTPNGKLLVSSGHFDNCIMITPFDAPSARQSLSGHKDIVTNLCLSSNGLLLGTGSMDTTVRIWQLFGTLDKFFFCVVFYLVCLVLVDLLLFCSVVVVLYVLFSLFWLLGLVWFDLVWFGLFC
jgi:hypothetical protein